MGSVDGETRVLVVGEEPPTLRLPETGRTTAVREIADLERADHSLDGVDCVLVWGGDHEAPSTAVEAVRAQAPDVPVVVVYEDEAVGRRSLEAGATDVFSIGVLTPDLLAKRISGLLERQRRDRRRERKSGMFDALMDDLPVFLYFKDEEGRFYRVGDVVSDFLQDVVGRKELWPEEDSGLRPEERRLLEDGDPVIRNERRGTTPVDFHSEWVVDTKVPWREDGEIRGIVGVTQDVTEQKERERALERQNERLEQFASMVSHDLRNPLNVAQGHLDVAGNGDDESLDRISWALDRMEELIEDLLALARQGRMVDETELIAVVDVVEDAWRAIDAPEAELVVEFDGETAIEADGSRLREVFENLFRNAVEHAGEGVTVRVGPLSDASGFYVADDGPGIPEHEREDVFASGYTTSEDGSGFGLAIVQSIVQAHQWSIEVADGSAGGGARFEITDVDLLSGVRDEESSIEVPVAAGATPIGKRFVVTGSGKNVWQFDNEFHFVQTTVEPGATLTARVVGLDPTARWSKAGVMIRDRLGPHAGQVFAAITAEDGSEFGYSDYPASPTQTRQLGDGASPAYWCRIEYDGETVRASVSPDGESWREAGKRSVAFGDAVHAGLFVSSVDETASATATFDAVSGLDEWRNLDVGDVRIPGSVTVLE